MLKFLIKIFLSEAVVLTRHCLCDERLERIKPSSTERKSIAGYQSQDITKENFLKLLIFFLVVGKKSLKQKF